MSNASADPEAAATPLDAGFSLVEALVALFLFGSAAVGLVHLQTQSLRLLQATETRALAELVAQNQLVTALAAQAPPAMGQTQGEVALADRDWVWRQAIEMTEDRGMLQVSVAVSAAEDDDAVMAEAIAFTPVPATAP